MKTAVIIFPSPQESFSGRKVDGILSCIQEIKVDSLEILSPKDDVGFSNRFDTFRDTVENLLIFIPNDLPFDLKQIVADKIDSPLCENESVDAMFYGQSEVEKFKDFASARLIPTDCTLIPNERGRMQGFLYEEKDFSVAVLPSQVEELEAVCKDFLQPYFLSKHGRYEKPFVIKYLGLKEKVVQRLEEIKSTNGNFNFCVSEKYRDCTVQIFFEKGIDKSEQERTLKSVCVSLDDGFYSKEDITLSQAVLTLLKLGNKKIATAESFTGGRIVGEILKNSGASAVVYEGIISYSNESKIERLGVAKEDISTVGAVSSKVAYQMAVGLLKNPAVDLAISSTGIAGPKSDNTSKPVGLCYIGIGTRLGVDIYKYNLGGDREEITETAKNIALFLAIKKLKNF